MAKLYFRYGAMNCGKSTVLLQVAHNYDERDNKILLIKPGTDLKGGNKIVSRVGIERDVDYLIGKEESVIDKIKGEFKGLDCILADEAQFFSREQIDELFYIVKLYEIPVICYGLRTDFKTNLFPGSERLLAIADEIDEMATICRCGQKARFNARIVNGEFVSEGEQVAIDEMNNVSYESLCGECYLDKVMNIEKPKILYKKQGNKKIKEYV